MPSGYQFAELPQILGNLGIANLNTGDKSR